MDFPIAKLDELERVVCRCVGSGGSSAVLAPLGITWPEAAERVMQAQIPLRPQSMARAVRELVSERGLNEDIDNVITLLKLKCVSVSDSREWHAVRALEPQDCAEDPTLQLLGPRVGRALKRLLGKDTRYSPHVVSTRVGELVYLSVEAAPATAGGKTRTPLYACATPGLRAVFVSQLGSKQLITATVNGLGYGTWRNAALRGRHIPSLIRMLEQDTNTGIRHLDGPLPYEPTPKQTQDGIDFTLTSYNAQYVEDVLGPESAQLNSLELLSDQPVHDTDVLPDGNMKISLKLETSSVAQALAALVSHKAIAADSGWFQVFHRAQKNRFTLKRHL